MLLGFLQDTSLFRNADANKMVPIRSSKLYVYVYCVGAPEFSSSCTNVNRIFLYSYLQKKIISYLSIFYKPRAKNESVLRVKQHFMVFLNS